MVALQLIFGLTSTSISVYLQYSRQILILILQKEPDAAIKILSTNNIEKYKKAISNKYLSLDSVWCTMDGLKIYLEQSGKDIIQNMFYNGWTHNHYVSAVIVFCPDGTIPIATYNVPGCFHDSTIADWGNIYKKLECIYTNTGGKCTVDSAFSKKNYAFLIKSSQTDPILDDFHDYEINDQATSMRQSAEWGTRALQASFPRLKDRLVFEEYGERKLIFKLFFLLYNLRARRVGINQILNTYMPELRKNPKLTFVAPLLEK